MEFISSSFFLFFVLFYLLYLLTQQNLKLQNIVLMFGSFAFYAYLGDKFAVVLVTLTIFAYLVGRIVGRDAIDGKTKRRILTISVLMVAASLTFLKVFPRYEGVLTGGGQNFLRHVFFPIGISFYSFQVIGYLVDVRRGRCEPERDFAAFAILVSFFPKLVSGPLVRAAKFLDQVKTKREILPWKVDTGIYLVLWGIFKKAVVADNLARLIVNPVFDGELSGFANFAAATLGFSLQLYADFSGYTDIARGVAYLLGFELPLNFRLPYFAISPQDFWNRWHISLSEWIREYVYFPVSRLLLKMTGRKYQVLVRFLTVEVTMILFGLWHGVGRNYVVWGAYHGILMFVFGVLDDSQVLTRTWETGKEKLAYLGRMVLVFVLVMAGWAVFRLEGTFTWTILRGYLSVGEGLQVVLWPLVLYSLPLAAVSLWQYVTGDLLAVVKAKLPVKVLFYAALVVGYLLFSIHETNNFIYFQF